MPDYTRDEQELIRDTEHAMLPIGTTRLIEGRQFVYVGKEEGWMLVCDARYEDLFVGRE